MFCVEVHKTFISTNIGKRHILLGLLTEYLTFCIPPAAVAAISVEGQNQDRKKLQSAVHSATRILSICVY